MEFRDAYSEFIKLCAESGNSRVMDRIKTGTYHAEKTFLKNVWWPAFGNFNALYPEHQVRDFKEGFRYLDFAYIHPRFQIAIEIDGFTSHSREISEDGFTDDRRRQNDLIIDGWRILRFSYTDVRSAPRICQQTIQQLLGRLTGDVRGSLRDLALIDREIIRLALTLTRPITVKDVASRCQLERKAALRHLKNLACQGWFIPASGKERIGSYIIPPSRTNVRIY